MNQSPPVIGGYKLGQTCHDEPRAPMQPLDPKLGFNLGWDYYTYRIGPPEHAADYPAFMEGYDAARNRVHTHDNDRFIRKHLQLRYNAWRRNRVFDERVTPEFLRQIDVARCPITWETLTHGAMLESDWSVDRIHNDCAYACGNLVVVSTRANKLKAAKSYDEICDLSLTDTPGSQIIDGLDPFQWRRWLFISSLNFPVSRDDSESGFDYTVAPCVMRPPPATMYNPSCLMQMALANKASNRADHKLYQTVTAALPADRKSAFVKLSHQVERVKRKIRGRPLDVWHNTNLFARFVEFYNTLSAAQQFDVLEIAGGQILAHHKVSLDFARLNVLNPNEWHAETGGYLESLNLR